MQRSLTHAEIVQQFADEWVLVGDPQTNAAREVESGYVLCHSKDRDEVYRQLTKMRPSRFALLYAGKIPEGTAIVL